MFYEEASISDYTTHLLFIISGLLRYSIWQVYMNIMQERMQSMITTDMLLINKVAKRPLRSSLFWMGTLL